MTAKAKQILITTESREVFIIRKADRSPVDGFCPLCGGQVIPEMELCVSGREPEGANKDNDRTDSNARPAGNLV